VISNLGMNNDKIDAGLGALAAISHAT